MVPGPSQRGSTSLVGPTRYSNSLNGSVLGPNNQPLHDVRVELRDTHGMVVSSTVTGGAGACGRAALGPHQANIITLAVNKTAQVMGLKLNFVFMVAINTRSCSDLSRAVCSAIIRAAFVISALFV